MGIKEAFRRVIGIAYLESRWIKRQPLWIVQGLVAGIGFIFILFAWGSTEALRNLIVAYVIAGSWGLGLNIIAQAIGWARTLGEYEWYVASPITLYDYFLGTVLGTMPFLLSNIIPAIILAVILNISLVRFLALMSLMPISLLIGMFLSLSIILRIRSPTNISAITNPLYTATTILPPVYYPLSILPKEIRFVCLAIPTTSLTELGKWIMLGRTTIPIQYSLASILIWIIILMLVIKQKLRWGLE